MKLQFTIFSICFAVLISSAGFAALKTSTNNVSGDTYDVKFEGSFDPRLILTSDAEGCDNFNSGSERAHCKLGYYLGRAHASLGILAAVIPNCVRSPKHELFFSYYGSYLLEDGSRIIGLVRGIDNARTEEKFGRTWGDTNNETLQTISASTYQTIKQQFSVVKQSDLPNVCENFRSQIRGGDLGVMVYLNSYLKELKKSYPKDYKEAQASISVIIQAFKKLENAKNI